MIDWVEVPRVAYQLSLDHGRNAYVYAAKLAAEAALAGKVEDAEFWNTVSATLTPRTFEQK